MSDDDMEFVVVTADRLGPDGIFFGDVFLVINDGNGTQTTTRFGSLAEAITANPDAIVQLHIPTPNGILIVNVAPDFPDDLLDQFLEAVENMGDFSWLEEALDTAAQLESILTLDAVENLIDCGGDFLAGCTEFIPPDEAAGFPAEFRIIISTNDGQQAGAGDDLSLAEMSLALAHELGHVIQHALALAATEFQSDALANLTAEALAAVQQQTNAPTDEIVAEYIRLELQGENYLTGGLTSDNLLDSPTTGSPGDMDIQGSNGSDLLQGASGDDTIDGNRGNDVIDGGLGNDVFFFSAGDGLDVLFDFGGIDTINLSGVALSDITLRTLEGGSTLGILYGSSASRILVQGWDLAGAGIESLVASDGSLTYSQILASAPTNHAPNVPSAGQRFVIKNADYFGGFVKNISTTDLNGDSLNYSITQITGNLPNTNWWLQGGNLYTNANWTLSTRAQVYITIKASDGFTSTEYVITVEFREPLSGGGEPWFPIVFDLDNDGLELINPLESSIRIDLDGDGKKELVGWVAPDDGFLALDRNGDGQITGDEISFAGDLEGAQTDLEGLNAYDTNGDGIFGIDDTQFSEFIIWQDLNQDGIAQADELRPLSDFGIVGINLNGSATGAEFDDGLENIIISTTSFIREDGSIGEAGDVVLRMIQGADNSLHSAIISGETIGVVDVDDPLEQSEGQSFVSASRLNDILSSSDGNEDDYLLLSEVLIADDQDFSGEVPTGDSEFLCDDPLIC